jgi:DNA ligase-1
MLDDPRLEGLDGELIVGEPSAEDVFNVTTSQVRREKSQPFFTYFIFDNFLSPLPFSDRQLLLHDVPPIPFIHHLAQNLIHTPEQLLAAETTALSLGYEGIILRSPAGKYKYNRSTVREGGMLKLKRFTDAEAVVVGYEERLHNGNAAEVSELGLTRRSSHQANKIPTNSLGALIVEMDGMRFNVGTGFTEHQRVHLWEERETLPGRLAKIKYFKPGTMEKPRHPVFLGFRMAEDVG